MLAASFTSIETIINSSVTTGSVPLELKLNHVTPRLKKASLGSSDLNNFRPVSNLPFISKVLEKAISMQLVDYLAENNLQEPMQSAYRKHHSTETAVLRVQHDILEALSCRKGCLMVLLCLSPAFDTVDHREVLTDLDIGSAGVALNWFLSYLSDRRQAVKIGTSLQSLVNYSLVPRKALFSHQSFLHCTQPHLAAFFGHKV